MSKKRAQCRNGGKAWPFHAGLPAEDYATEPIVVAVRREFAEEVSALAGPCR